MALRIGIGKNLRIQPSGVSWSTDCTPLSIDVTQITGGNRITWTDNPSCTDEDGYEVWVSIDGGAYALLDTVAAGVGTYDDNTDYAGSQVTYKVRAYKGTSYSAFTDESEIVIEPNIENLAVVWLEDHAVITFDGVAGWETELYSSLDDITYSLVTTIADGTETYTDHTWQGTTVYFKARAKQGVEFGDYCASINIATPLVFKWDNNPYTAFSIGAFGLPANKTVTIYWGWGTPENHDDITLNNQVTLAANATASDPLYIKLYGDLNSITTFNIASSVKRYGNLSKWVIPTGVTTFYLFGCAFTGDISGWTIPPALVDFRIYANAFTGDLSSWSLPVTNTIVWLTETNATNEFTGCPRGSLKQVEASVGGYRLFHAAVPTAGVDAFLAYANTYFATNTPIKNSIFVLSGTGMGTPTGGNSNTDLVGIKAKYVAAGFTATIYNNT
jgi:hypothetical protein